MAAPPSANRPSRAHEALIERLLMDAVFTFAWKRLRRYGLCREDREDVAQDVVVTAYLRWGTYCPSRGNIEQWLSGIVCREGANFLRKRGQQAEADAEAALAGVSVAVNPEKSMFLKALAHEVLDFLPPDERRAVSLYELEGKTFEEIAKIEGISVSTAHGRHARGIAKMRQRMEEQKASGVILLPASLSAALGPDDRESDPPPEVVERAWRHVAAKLGFDAPPPSESPPSGTRRIAPPPPQGEARAPSSSPPRGRGACPRRLGPLGVLLCGLAGVAALQRHSVPPPTAPAAAAAAHHASVAGPLVGATEPSAAAAPTPQSDPGSAIVDGRLDDAARALAEHGRRPDEGKAASARRADMLSMLCARVRTAAPGEVTPELSKRCAAQP